MQFSCISCFFCLISFVSLNICDYLTHTLYSLYKKKGNIILQYIGLLWSIYPLVKGFHIK